MQNKRRKFIIEGNFQARFILRFVIIIIGAALLSTGTILGVFYFKYQYGDADLNHLIIMVTPEGTTDVASLFQIVLTPLIIANLALLLVIVPFSLLYSQKIAGPIYRLEHSMDLLIEGELDFMINLRKNDEFQYLADKMNGLIDYMRRNIGEVKSSYRLIKDKISRLYLLLRKGDLDFTSLKKEIVELERFFKERKEPFNY